MNHSFNTKIAEKYGVEGAIIIENFYFWIQKNKANDKHFYDESYWTYNSIKAFTELFPYWTTRQIERILKNLEEKGAIKTGNYNKIAYDRTKWYALTETVKCIYANGEMETTKRGNGNTQTVEPIPYINTDDKPDNNTDKETRHKYGEYFHVLLTDSQHKKLLDEWGEAALQSMITRLDEYIEMTGKSYKNHSLVLKKWRTKDKNESSAMTAGESQGIRKVKTIFEEEL